MIQIKSDIGNRRAFLAIREAPKRARTGVRQGFYFLGKENVKLTRAEITKKDKKGRIYHIRIKGRLKRHQASAPGQYPANLTGKLRKSLDFVVRGNDRMEFGAFVPYAGFLEKGTKKMEPRPSLANTVKATEKIAVQFMIQEIGKRLIR